MHWRPDTCECELEIKRDADGGWLSGSTVKACPEHAALAGTAQHYDVVLKENRGKNAAVNAAMELLPELIEVYLDDDGNPAKRFKPGMRPAHLYKPGADAASRTIEVQVKVSAAKALAFAAQYAALTPPFEVASVSKIEGAL